MRTLRRPGALIAATLFCVTVAIAAPAEPGFEGWGRGQAYDRLYDVNHEVVARSTVVRVERFVPRPGMAEGVRVFVASGPDSIWVHLGPAPFVEAQDLALAAGDLVLVVGPHVMFDGSPVILASRVTTKDGRTVRLRDANGRPAWTNFHRRPPA